MSNPYEIDNVQYPSGFFNNLSIPVTEETLRACTLTPLLRSQLNPGTDFVFTMDDAISTAERHMFILDPNATSLQLNPVKLVQDWVNLVRWEVSTFWNTYPGTPDEIAHTDNVHVHYTHEHPKRSGEVLAEGLALLFLQDRMNIPPQCFWFYKGGKARPDFIFDTTFRGAGVMWNGSQFGVEARCRKSQANLYDIDEKDLHKKKVNNPQLSAVLGVYFFYGRGSHPRNLEPMTRIHLADPQQEGLPLTNTQRAWVIINHYLGATSRIGMWEHRDHLATCLHQAAHGVYPDQRMNLDDRRIQRTVPQPGREPGDRHDFRGRHFNSLLAAASVSPKSQDETKIIRKTIQLRLNSGDLGQHVFRGIRRDVLSLIENCQWGELENYRDPDAGGHSPGEAITADGYLVQQSPITDRSSEEARDVIKQLGLMGFRV